MSNTEKYTDSKGLFVDTIIFALECPGKISDYTNRGFERVLGPVFDYFTEHSGPPKNRVSYVAKAKMSKLEEISLN